MNKNLNRMGNYLDGVEVQYETEDQKQVIVQALRDILNLDEEQLRTQRYRNYFGQEAQWRFQDVLQAYFVPDDSLKSVGSDFYKESQEQEVRDYVESLLRDLTGVTRTPIQ